LMMQDLTRRNKRMELVSRRKPRHKEDFHAEKLGGKKGNTGKLWYIIDLEKKGSCKQKVR